MYVTSPFFCFVFCKLKDIDQTFAGEFHYKSGKIDIDKILYCVESEIKIEIIFVK